MSATVSEFSGQTSWMGGTRCDTQQLGRTAALHGPGGSLGCVACKPIDCEPNNNLDASYNLDASFKRKKCQK